MTENKNKSETIIVPKKISVFEDQKTKARTVAFPFDYPNEGFKGVIMVTKLSKSSWIPSEDIESIVINFK